MGNICKDCDDRIQIFHRLDDGNQSSDSDIEIDVVNANKTPLPPANILPTLNNNCRPETPVIVDDDDMLYNLFMQKVDQQRLQRHLPPQITQLPHIETQQPQQFINHFNPLYTPPQSNVGSEGDDSKVIEVLTSRESTPISIERNATPVPTAPPIMPEIIDNKGHRIVAIIDLDDGDEVPISSDKTADAIDVNCTQTHVSPAVPSSNLLNFIVASAKYQTEQQDDGNIVVTPSKVIENLNNSGAVGPASVAAVSSNGESPAETSPSKSKNRKSYDDKELRLVASLNLVSSDSETDEPTKKPTTKQSTPTLDPNRFNCKQCKIHFPDAECLAVHEQIHQGIKCPVCQFGYSQEQRLIHHMRYKHRTYSGPDLAEKPRAAQDSAMTIRLRFKQRKTFYECQLCGRIDDIYKDHKEHIIKKHPVESKKLNDPIMKELKCPVCKCKCGTQYLTLCRHLISDHQYGQYKSHLRELLHVSGFGWNASRQQEVTKTARIYQFIKRKTFFFQCKTCQKVVGGYFNHLRHHAKHGKDAKAVANNSQKSPETNIVNKKDSKLAQVLNSTKTLKKIKQKISQKDSKSCKKLNSTPIKKPHISKKSLKPTKSATTVSAEKSKVTSQKPKENIDDEPIFKKPKSISPKAKQKNYKPKNKSQKPIETVIQTIDKSSNKSKRKRSKEDATITKSQLKKVKVKPAPIKLINLQSYKCQYCPKKIKGFRLYNLHLLSEHKNNEYEECLKCRHTHLHGSHPKECTEISVTCNKQWRKYVKHLQTDANYQSQPKTNNTSVDCTQEESKPKVPETEIKKRLNNDILPALQMTDKPMWLKDLLKMSESKNNCSSSSNANCNNNYNEKDISMTKTASVSILSQPTQSVVPCCFCLHLFTSNKELQDHVRVQHSKNNEVLMKFTAPIRS